MKQIVVPASFPYTVEFIRRRCRTVENLIVWDQGAVAIYDVTDREAPVAYRVDFACTVASRLRDPVVPGKDLVAGV